ncbi:MAG: DoxX family protein [Deltaproteobacteria bacterium]
MRVGFLIGRIVLGLYYLVTGIMDVINFKMLAGYAASKGVPAAEAAVIVAHLLLVLAGFCFLTGWRPALGVAAVVVFLIPVTFTMHAFWAETAPQMKQMQMINFTKNMALLGSALMFLGIPRPWAYSVESREPLAGGRGATQ